jgi:hypothetical protein
MVVLGQRSIGHPATPCTAFKAFASAFGIDDWGSRLQLSPDKQSDVQSKRLRHVNDMLVFYFSGHGVEGTKLNQADAGLVLATRAVSVEAESGFPKRAEGRSLGA